MSVIRGSQNAGHYYSNIVMPQVVDVNFTVSASDSGGLGVTSVKSNGWVNNVFMHTSATPGAGNSGITNPNPASGLIWIQLKQNFNVFIGVKASFQPPVTGAALTSVTSGTAYEIVDVNSSTAAQWQAVGLPAGLTPTNGQAFVANTSAAIAGGGSVKTVTTSAVFRVEVVGDPSQSIASSNIASYGGGWVLLQCLDASSALVAPTAGTVVSLELLYDRSSVTVDGL